MPKTYKKSTKYSKKSCKKSKKHSKKSKKYSNKSKKHSKKHTRKHRFHGGNYETDSTTQSLNGVPLTKKATITVPGIGSMTQSEYETYMENLIHNGSDF
jgi:hypothetical protein